MGLPKKGQAGRNEHIVDPQSKAALALLAPTQAKQKRRRQEETDVAAVPFSAPVADEGNEVDEGSRLSSGLVRFIRFFRRLRVDASLRPRRVILVTAANGE